jgi:hypothetical protein
MVRKLFVAVALAVVLAGCAGLGGSSGDATAALGAQQAAAGGDGSVDAGAEKQRRRSAGESTSGGDGGDGSDGVPGNAAVRTNRSLIKTGEVRLEVENFTTARQRLTADVRERGGYVSGSDVTLHTSGDWTWRTGHLVVRVPSGNFSGMMSATRERGTVVSANTGTKDVTEQLVDMDARLQNTKDQRDRLRTLYEEANTTEKLLRIGERLSSVQGEIERLEAKRRALRGKVAYSTLRIELAEPEPDVAYDDPNAFHEQSLDGAFGRSLRGVVVLAKTTLVAGVAAVPWAVALGIPAVLVVGLGRRLHRASSWSFRRGDD